VGDLVGVLDTVAMKFEISFLAQSRTGAETPVPGRETPISAGSVAPVAVDTLWILPTVCGSASGCRASG